MADLPILYDELAEWFHLLTAPADYAEEAETYRAALVEAASGPVRSVLELGSGGGNNASHLKHDFDLTLTDLSPRMLELSRTINPECEHLAGDMRTLQLARAFDGVFVHDAVMYLTTEADLAAAIETAFAHCRPGGAAVFAPDCTKETFRPYTSHGGHDGADGRGLRYLEWVWDPDPGDTTCRADYALLLREPSGEIRGATDHHVVGLFAEEVWLRLLAAAGFEAGAVSSPHAEDAAGQAVLFVARRPVA